MKIEALHDDLTYDVREARIQAIHVDGSDPSLAGVSIYLVTPDGQWAIWETFDVGPFDSPDATKPILAAIERVVRHLLT